MAIRSASFSVYSPLHRRGTDEGGDAVHRGVSGHFEQGAHQRLHERPHHVHQTVVQQEGKEHAAHRNNPRHADDDGGHGGPAGGGADDELRPREAGDRGVHRIDQRKDAAHQIKHGVNKGFAAVIPAQPRAFGREELAVNAEDTVECDNDRDAPESRVAQGVDEVVVDMAERHVAFAVDGNVDEKHEDGDRRKKNGFQRADRFAPKGKFQPVHQQNVVEVQRRAFLRREVVVEDLVRVHGILPPDLFAFFPILLKREDGEKLEDDVGRQVGCDLAVIVGGKHLDDVEAREVDRRQRPHQRQGFQ